MNRKYTIVVGGMRRLWLLCMSVGFFGFGRAVESFEPTPFMVTNNSAFVLHDLIKNYERFTSALLGICDQNMVNGCYPDVDTTINIVRTFFNEFKQIPLLLINEQSSSTELDRQLYPEYRATFEKQVVQGLVSAIQANKNIVYTSFFSRELYQDLVILAKALEGAPAKKVTFHAIDSAYASYCAYQNYYNQSEIQIEDSATSFEKLSRYAKSLTFANDESRFSECLNCFNVQILFEQLTIWFSKYFPETSLTVIVHDSSAHYQDYLKEHNQEHADVLAAVDLDGATCIEEYNQLSRKTLAAKPDSYNTYLSRTTETESLPFLVMLSTKEIPTVFPDIEKPVYTYVARLKVGHDSNKNW